MKTFPHVPSMFLVSLVCLMAPADAAWQRLEGPVGGDLSSLQVHGSHIVAENWFSNGVFTSTDCGATWSRAVMQAHDEASASARDTIFAAACDGLLRSVDSGVHWSRVPLTGLVDSQFTAFAASKGRLYFGTPSGIVVTRDHGATWKPANEGMTDKWATAILADGDTVLAGTNAGVYRSVDGGAHWSLSNEGITNTLFAGFAKGGGSVFVGTNDGTFRSKDGGINWEFFGPHDVWGGAILSISVIGDSLYATTMEGGVYVSGLGSEHWRVFSDKIANSFAKCADTFVVGTRDGIARSSDKGKTWKRSNKGLPRLDVYSLAATESVVLAGTATDGLFHAANPGGEWSWSESPFADLANNPFLADGGAIYGASRTGLYTMASTGSAWSFVENSDLQPQATSFAKDGDTLILGTEGGQVYLSADSGAKWTARDSGLARVKVRAMLAQGGEIFAGTKDSGVYWWRKGGTRWSKIVPESGKDGYVMTFVRTRNSLFVLAFAGLVKYTRDGDGWIRSGPLPATNKFNAIVARNSVLYAGGNGGVFASFDEGKTWPNVGSDFKVSSASSTGASWVVSLALNATTLFAGAEGDGIWQRPLSEMTESSVHAFPRRGIAPEALRVSWRSPVGRKTTIDFDLDAPQDLVATIHDPRGRLLAALWNGHLEAGLHTMSWDDSKVQSGTYLLRWSAGASCGTRRIQVLH